MMLRHCFFGLTTFVMFASAAWGELRHQYTFNDGTASDLVGGMDGTIVNPMSVPDNVGGHLDLRSNDTAFSSQEGGTGDFTRFVEGVYVDLPNFMISDLGFESSGILTFEAWATQESRRTWSRIFSFGSSNMGEDTASGADSSAVSVVFLTPQSGANTVRLDSRNGAGTPADGIADFAPPLSTGVQHHYVAVLDRTDTTEGADGSMYLYLDGQLGASAPIAGQFDLAFLGGTTGDVNNWLGRSQWNDPLLDGTINEFRVYDHALSAQEVADSFETGPEAVNPRFVINRDDQSVALVSKGLDGDLAGYSLGSAFGSLDDAGWTPISGRLDASGDGSFDDAAWSIDESEVGSLAESADEGTGGGLTRDTSISLGNIWFPSPVEDISAEVQLADGSVVFAEVVFEGNDGAPFGRSDLNFDGVVDANDWPVFVEGLFGDYSGMSPAQAYTMGDLNGDLVSNVRDFQIFQADFIAANGAAAFTALGASVPEPSTAALAVALAVVAGALVVCRRNCSFIPLRQTVRIRSFAAFIVVVAAVFFYETSSFAEMVHRWSFNETEGTVVADSIGGADGQIIGGGGFLGGGQVTLEGGSSASASYVDLPNGLISGLTDATLEGWATIDGAQSWGRLFDFGSTDGGELTGPGGGGQGQDYIFMSASRGTNISQQRAGIRNLDPAFGGSEAGPVGGVENTLDTEIPTELGEEFHFALVYDSAAGQMHHYRNGRFVESQNVTIALGNINDVNNWLGRSNWTADANFQGSFNEFRIYDSALDDFEMGTSFVGGPDVGPEGPPVLELEVDTGTGNVVLHNRQQDPIDLNFYEIESAGGALNADGWASLDSQDIDSLGSGPGESWDAGGGSNEFLLGEAFLLGLSELAPSSSIDLGQAFNPSVFGPGQNGDLQFRYLRGDGLGLIGKVTYMGEPPLGIDGDYNGNGTVEQADLDLVLLNWGQSGVPGGWINDLPEGNIDQAELDGVLLNWGNSAPLGVGAGVPEPSTAVFAALAGLLATAAAVVRQARRGRS